MNETTRKKTLRTIAGIAAAVLLFFASGYKVPGLDATAEPYFGEAIGKAGLAYATCRLINASVSMVKESNLQVEPAGVGVSLAVGQVLDPVDDMTERLSDVLVTAIASLGVQRLAYEMGVSLAFPALAVLLLLLSLLTWVEGPRVRSFRILLWRLALLLLAARLFLPLSAAANRFVDRHFFQERITAANEKLSVGFAELEKLRDFSLPERDGVLGTLENSAAFVKKKTVEFRDALAVFVTNTGDIIENLLQLTYLYIGLFLIQVLLLPLVSFWLLVKTGNALFQTGIPPVLHASDRERAER